MDMCTIAEAIDKEADIAAAASEIMWVIELAGQSHKSEVSVESILDCVHLMETTLYEHKNKLHALSDSLFSIWSGSASLPPPKSSEK